MIIQFRFPVTTAASLIVEIFHENRARWKVDAKLGNQASWYRYPTRR